MDNIELLREFKKWIIEHSQYEDDLDTIEHYKEMLKDIEREEEIDRIKEKKK